MHYIFIFLLLPISVWPATKSEINEARSSIMALIAPLFPGATAKRPAGTEKFRVDGCEKHKIDWTQLLFKQKPVVLKYTFKDGCDLQGDIAPKLLEPFLVQLQLRNLEHYNAIESQNKVTAALEVKPLLFLEMRSGSLSGKKGKVKFEADYQVRINPLKSKAIDENLGGEIRITEIYGEKVNIKEKIKIK